MARSLPRQDSAATRLQPGRGSSFQWNNRSLLISKVQPSDAGIYTCQLNVVIHNQQFKVSRALLLHVEGDFSCRWCVS